MALKTYIDEVSPKAAKAAKPKKPVKTKVSETNSLSNKGALISEINRVGKKSTAPAPKQSKKPELEDKIDTPPIVESVTEAENLEAETPALATTTETTMILEAITLLIQKIDEMNSVEPVINIPAPIVNIPEVTMPQPTINVTVPGQRKVITTVTRDERGLITEKIDTPVDDDYIAEELINDEAGE